MVLYFVLDPQDVSLGTPSEKDPDPGRMVTAVQTGSLGTDNLPSYVRPSYIKGPLIANQAGYQLNPIPPDRGLSDIMCS